MTVQPSSTATTLLPCPFCGGAPFYPNYDAGDDDFVVQCACGASSQYSDVQADVISAWNTRAAAQRPANPDAVKMYADALDAANARIAELEARAWTVAQAAPEPVLSGLQEDMILMGFHHAPTPQPTQGGDKGEVVKAIVDFLDAAYDAIGDLGVDNQGNVRWAALVNIQREIGQKARDFAAAPQPASNANYEKAIALLDLSTWYLTPAAQRNWEERVEQFLADPSRPVDIPPRPTAAAYAESERLPTCGNLLADINKAAHAAGTNAWVREVLKQAHRAIRLSAPLASTDREGGK